VTLYLVSEARESTYRRLRRNYMRCGKTNYCGSAPRNCSRSFARRYGWENDLGGFYQDGTTHGNPDVHARQHNVSDESRIGVLEVGWHVDFGKPVQISDSGVDDQFPNVRGGDNVIKVIPDDDSVDLLVEEVNYQSRRYGRELAQLSARSTDAASPGPSGPTA